MANAQELASEVEATDGLLAGIDAGELSVRAQLPTATAARGA